MRKARLLANTSLCAAAVLVLAAPGSLSAVQSATLVECHKNILSNEALQPCKTTTSESEITSELQVQADLRPDPQEDPGLTCRFLFWTFDGRQFPPESLPTSITVAEEEAENAVAWYRCSRGGDGVRDGNGFRITYTAIDMTAGNIIQEPFIESISPAGAEGNCLTVAPCSSPPNVDPNGATAKSAVGTVEFEHWNNHPQGQRTIDPDPAAWLEIAFYAAEDDEGACGVLARAGLTGPCVSLVDLEDLILAEDLIGVVEVDRICWYVLNCPGCGREGLCPGWEISFEGLDGVEIAVHERESGRVVARAERIEEDLQILSFTPKAGRTPGAGYLLSFTPRKGYAGPARVPLRATLDATCSGR